MKTTRGDARREIEQKRLKERLFANLLRNCRDRFHHARQHIPPLPRFANRLRDLWQ